MIGQAGKVEEGAVAGAESQSQKLLTWDGANDKLLTCNGQKQGLVTWETDRIRLLSDNKNTTDFYVTCDNTVIPSTAYRAVNNGGLKAVTVMAKPGNDTYITFDNISVMDAPQIRNILQTEKRPTAVAKFDTLQIVDDIKIPTEKWNTTVIPEPITKSMPRFGNGGATQVITNTSINKYDLFLIDQGSK